ncbi:MAG: hypothetical protein AAFU64_20335, partial [Bacteroidota bacterium]
MPLLVFCPDIIAQNLLIDRLVLVNTVSNQDIQVLSPGAVISFSEFGQTPLSIRAETDDPLVKSVTFRLTGPKSHFQRENVEPYTLWGDQGLPDYDGEILSPGNYEIFVQAFPEKLARGIPGALFRLKFSVEASNPQITRLEIFETDERFGTFRRPLRDGDRINIDDLIPGFPFFTIQAFTNPHQIGSIHFCLEGPIDHQQTENQPPYVVFGDIKNNRFNATRPFDFNSRRLAAGDYTLKVIPYSLPNRQGMAGDTTL